jgi:hypothetical protein
VQLCLNVFHITLISTNSGAKGCHKGCCMPDPLGTLHCDMCRQLLLWYIWFKRKCIPAILIIPLTRVKVFLPWLCKQHVWQQQLHPAARVAAVTIRIVLCEPVPLAPAAAVTCPCWQPSNGGKPLCMAQLG